MTRRFLSLAVLPLALLACSASPARECEGPGDCGGNPCCWSVVNVNDQGTACEAAPSACVPVMGVDTLTTRVCQTDADCTSGGISTTLTHCCPATSHPFKACLSGCSP
jgi:hypothetical protein